jgi:hypothetical protein
VRDATFSSDVPPAPQTVPGVGGYSVYRASLGTLGATDNTAPVVNCAGG